MLLWRMFWRERLIAFGEMSSPMTCREGQVRCSWAYSWREIQPVPEQMSRILMGVGFGVVLARSSSRRMRESSRVYASVSGLVVCVIF